MPIGELARLRACECDKFVHVLSRHVAMDYKDARREDHERDRGQVLDRIVRQLFIQARIDGNGGTGHHQRVTVGRGRCGTLDRRPRRVCPRPRQTCLQAAAPRCQGDRLAENRREFERLCQGRRIGQTRRAIRATPSAQQRKPIRASFPLLLAPPSRRCGIKSAASANEPLTSTQCSKMSTEVFFLCCGAGIAEESTVETSYPSPGDLRSAAAECARSSTLMRANASAKACSACPSAGITTLLSSVEPASGAPFMSSAVPAARKISSAVMRRCSRASS